MRFLILSDIHANYTALEACINEIKNINFDAIIWCGDYITDFPDSHKVINLIREYEKKYTCYIISGNREDYIIDFDKHKDPNKVNIRTRNNIVCTYNSLSKEDLKWIKNLPSSLTINLDDKNKIYVSHKCNYEYIENCKYKIFGHVHKQYTFRKDNVKYITPGSIGISDAGTIGAQFSVLEITPNIEKVEQYVINYDINKAIQILKETKIYSDEIGWGKMIEKELLTGFNYLDEIIREYNIFREQKNVLDESLELWHIAQQNIYRKFDVEKLNKTLF